MTDLDQATQHNPAAERLAAIAHRARPGQMPTHDRDHNRLVLAEDDAPDLLEFARDVLSLTRNTDGEDLPDHVNIPVSEIRLAARHLGGGNG